MTQVEKDYQRKSGILGLMSAIIFMLALVFFGFLNPEFSFVEDFVSKLGAKGEPNAIWWNIIGFGLVGLVLFGFGIFYGKLLKDQFAGLLLASFGVGFSFTAFPMDMMDANADVSKAHVLAICLALASWLFGLARISSNALISKKIRNRANITAFLVVTPMIGFVLGFWSMPITHRLVFIVVFGWTAFTSIELLMMQNKALKLAPKEI
ncbi:MAG: DUF998 domain-containing protein [Bacteroidota bacterium]